MTVAKLAFLFVLGFSNGAIAENLPKLDIGMAFESARASGRVGTAQKTKPVDARPASPGEVIVTTIAGEGVETTSKPAQHGDMVVRNRCPRTGNEEYLVSAVKFETRYEGPFGRDGNTLWQEYHPIASDIDYFIVEASEGEFIFTAPWGEAMIAKPGDAIVQNPLDIQDTYRVAGMAFVCTYEVQ